MVFPIHKWLMQILGARANDQVLVRVHKPFVTFRVISPDDVLPVSGFTVDELPPSPPKANARA
jgi:hypothetical protein